MCRALVQGWRCPTSCPNNRLKCCLLNLVVLASLTNNHHSTNPRSENGDFCSPPDSQQRQSREAEAKALLPGVVTSTPHFSVLLPLSDTSLQTRGSRPATVLSQHWLPKGFLLPATRLFPCSHAIYQRVHEWLPLFRKEKRRKKRQKHLPNKPKF